jgi:hypothetical protein
MLKFSNLRYLLFKRYVFVAFAIFCFNSLLPTANPKQLTADSGEKPNDNSATPGSGDCP